MTKWIRPSGNAIELADTQNLNDYAVKAGWNLKAEITEVPVADFESMNKEQLEAHAKKLFGVDLDKRKSTETLVKEIRALMES